MKAFLTLAVIIATLASTTSAHASWTATLLAPTTATQSYVNGIEGATVVGNVQIGATTAEGHWLTPASPFVGLGTFGVEGIGGGLLVGSGFVGGVAGAAYYSLATRTFTSVHPGPPFVGSTLHGASPNTQVGLVNAFGTSTAALWRGTAASYVNLNPNVAVFSEAWAATDSIQVGMVSIGAKSTIAALWRGTPGSFVDLSGGARGSIAYGAFGETQVGWRMLGTTSGLNHAALWSGTAASFVDLHPAVSNAPTASSEALAVYENHQVGWALVSGQSHAFIWQGTAASAVDLNPFLPAGYVNAVATDISSDGSFLYVGGYTITPGTNRRQAVVWISPVPEPATWLSLGLGVLVLLRRCGNLGHPLQCRSED